MIRNTEGVLYPVICYTFNAPIEFVKSAHRGLLAGCNAMAKFCLWFMGLKVAHLAGDQLFEIKYNILRNVNVNM